MDEPTVPLAELQDIGERYAPTVLRSFFLSNQFRFPHSVRVNSISDLEALIPGTVETNALQKIQRTMILTVPAYILCLIAGAIAFASQADTWENIMDPVFQYRAVSQAIPSTTASVLMGYAVVSSVFSEFIACVQLPVPRVLSWNFFIYLVGLLSGTCSRALLAGNALSLVLIMKATPKLALVGLAPFGIGLGFLGVFLLIRTLIAMIARDNFEIINDPWLVFTRINPSVLFPVALSAQQRFDEGESSPCPCPDSLGVIDRAANCPPNFLEIRRIVHAAIVFEWNMFYAIALKNIVPFAIQADLVLASSLRMFLGILGYQVPLLPIYVFFLYDVGPSPLVQTSLVLTIVASVFTCILYSFPVYKRTVNDYSPS
jgi:hypothetical protein